MDLLHTKDKGGVVSSETFNITRITTAVGALIATFAAGREIFESEGFSSNQRLVIVVAVIAAVAVISAADIIGRSLATVPPPPAPNQPLNSGVINRPRTARKS